MAISNEQIVDAGKVLLNQRFIFIFRFSLIFLVIHLLLGFVRFFSLEMQRMIFLSN